MSVITTMLAALTLGSTLTLPTTASLVLSASPLVPSKAPIKAPARDPHVGEMAAKPAAATAAAEEKAALEAMSKAVGRKVVPGRRVQIETTRGKFVVVLFDKDAPKTAENFARLVKKGFYDGTPFHRVIEGFMAQGGDPTGTGGGGPGYHIPMEKVPLKNLRGSIAMARSQELDSAGSQFFINFVNNGFLDQKYDSSGKPSGGYVVFGQVVRGMDVVDKLTRTMDSQNSPIPGVRPDKIVKAKLL